MDTVAAPLPMIMIALMLGVPLEQLADFRRWSDSFIEMSEDTLPQYHDEDDVNAKIGDIIEFRDYFAEQLKDRVTNPRDDLLTKLTPGRVGRQAARARRTALDGAGAADRGQRDHPRPHRRRGQGARRAPRPAGDPRRVTRADARRGRGVPALRHPGHPHVPHRARRRRDPRAADPAAATSSVSSTRRRTATRTRGSAATSSTCGASPIRRSSRSGSPSTSASAPASPDARRASCMSELLDAVPQLRADRRHHARPPAHDAGDQDDAGGLPPLTARQDDDALHLEVDRWCPSRGRACSVRISSPCSLKSGDLPGTDGSSSNCTGVATSLYG